MASGIVISFEGLDASGKGTQIRLLTKLFEKLTVQYELGREPGETAYGEAARRMVQDPQFISRLNKGYKDVSGIPQLAEDEDLNAPAELFGYLVARSLFAEKRILPAIKQGKVFIADRCGDSSIAYQGFGQWNGEKDKVAFIKQCNAIALLGIPIARTYFLDISYEESRKRSLSGEFGQAQDRIEKRKQEYFDRVRDGYLTIAKQDPDRFFVIDGTLPPKAIAEIIENDIKKILASTGVL